MTFKRSINIGFVLIYLILLRQIVFEQLFYYHKHIYDTHISLRQFYVLGIMVIELLIEP